MPRIQRRDPPYLQVVQHVRDQILSGELNDGDLVSSARSLAREWDISLATATKALATLRAEGLVSGKPGIGTVVTAAETAQHSTRDRLVSIQRTGRIYPPGQHAKITAAEVVQAGQRIADALAIPLGAPVIRRHRVTYHHDRPASASTSWFDGALTESSPELLVTERLQQGTSAYIEETTGRRVRAGRDQMAAGEATEQDAADLGLRVGAPVLRERNWVYDEAGGTIEYGESVTSQGRWTSYSYEIGEQA